MSTDTEHPAYRLTQFASFTHPLNLDAALIFQRLGASAALKAVRGKGKKMNEFMSMVFAALLGNHELKIVLSKPFETWMTCEVGMNSTEELLELLPRSGWSIYHTLLDRIKSPEMKISGERTQVKLVKVSRADLGLPVDASDRTVYFVAEILGLDPCSLEVALQMRLRYKHQPKGADSFVYLATPDPSPGCYGGFIILQNNPDSEGKNKEHNAYWYKGLTLRGDAPKEFVFVKRQQ